MTLWLIYSIARDISADIFRLLRFGLSVIVFIVLLICITPIMGYLWLADRGRR